MAHTRQKVNLMRKIRLPLLPMIVTLMVKFLLLLLDVKVAVMNGFLILKVHLGSPFVGFGVDDNSN